MINKKKLLGAPFIFLSEKKSIFWGNITWSLHFCGVESRDKTSQRLSEYRLAMQSRGFFQHFKYEI